MLRTPSKRERPMSKQRSCGRDRARIAAAVPPNFRRAPRGGVRCMQLFGLDEMPPPDLAARGCSPARSASVSPHDGSGRRRPLDRLFDSSHGRPSSVRARKEPLRASWHSGLGKSLPGPSRRVPRRAQQWCKGMEFRPYIRVVGRFLGFARARRIAGRSGRCTRRALAPLTYCMLD